MSRAFPHVARGLCGALLALGLTAQVTAQTNPENNPDHCRAIWQKIGVPIGSTSDKTTIVCHLGYIVGHNDNTKTPNWVVERLHPEIIGTDSDDEKASRDGRNFVPDDKLPENARAVTGDYDGNGFDKGHNAPAADFGGNQDFLDDTFVFSNAVPQVGIGFNRSIWRTLESQVRGMIGDNRRELYVITGPVYQKARAIKVENDVCGTELTLPVVTPREICPATVGHPRAKCDAGVAVPSAMYKVVYDPVMQHAFAVLMENETHSGRYKKGRPYIQAHRVGIATIEDLTGLTFFSALPKRKQNQMRSNCVDVFVR